MTFEEKVDRLDGVFAYDTGCISSGIKDDKFKVELRKDFDLTEKLVTEVSKRYLNHDYTAEDIHALLKWADSELGLTY